VRARTSTGVSPVRGNPGLMKLDPSNEGTRS
jgi:hypothetical protein